MTDFISFTSLDFADELLELEGFIASRSGMPAVTANSELTGGFFLVTDSCSPGVLSSNTIFHIGMAIGLTLAGAAAAERFLDKLGSGIKSGVIFAERELATITSPAPDSSKLVGV